MREVNLAQREWSSRRAPLTHAQKSLDQANGSAYYTQGRNALITRRNTPFITIDYEQTLRRQWFAGET